jgi:hypothetical protein
MALVTPTIDSEKLIIGGYENRLKSLIIGMSGTDVL